MLPSELILFQTRVPTFSILLLIGVLSWLFVIWYEGIKDGFDEYKLFDIALTSLLLCFGVGAGLYFLLNWLAIYYPTNILVQFDPQIVNIALILWVSWIPVLLYTKKLKWSKFRIFDIYSLAHGVLIFEICLGSFFLTRNVNYLYSSILIFVLYISALRFRGYKFTSGVLFSVFNFFIGLLGFFFSRKTNYLLFYIIQFTISLLNLYLIRKRLMIPNFLPKDLLQKLKNKLLSKQRDLDKEANILKQEDPYLQPGRDSDNADYVDEAILEDAEKQIIDTVQEDIKSDKARVKKALNAMSKGTYGVCESCKQPIDKARLAAYPEATVCVSCAQKEEQLSDNA